VSPALLSLQRSGVCTTLRAMADGEPLVFTMRELNQDTSRVMGAIRNSGRPAYITLRGQYVAVVVPLKPGEIESQVLRELGERYRSEEGDER
jgi:antitoxin (DNA-binding transcriptional repressor) of toxin-antitoxin stability system